MKKYVALVLALMLCLSLCACGGDNDTPTNKTAMTREDMLSSANSFDYSTFSENAAENTIRAEETYVGNIYEISGFVDKINDDSCILKVLSSSGILEGFINVPLSRDELLMLNTNERITVVGEISEIISEKSIKLGSAYYISNEFEATVKIYSIVYASASDKLPKYATGSFSGFVDEYVAPLCNVYISGEDLATLNEDDEITITGKMVIYDSTNVHMHYGTKILFEIKDAELVQ